MFLERERKYVQVISDDTWHVALGDAFERFYSPVQWGMHARVVDKAAAAEFLARGTIRLQCNDDDVRVNLRHRHKEAYMLPDELPEKCGPRDSILLVRKRHSSDPAQPGFDNRYHFFLITWAEPSELEAEFDELRSEATARDSQKTASRASGAKKAASRKVCTPKREKPAEVVSNFYHPPRRKGFRKGLTGIRKPHRWRF